MPSKNKSMLLLVVPSYDNLVVVAFKLLSVAAGRCPLSLLLKTTFDKFLQLKILGRWFMLSALLLTQCIANQIRRVQAGITQCLVHGARTILTVLHHFTPTCESKKSVRQSVRPSVSHLVNLLVCRSVSESNRVTDRSINQSINLTRQLDFSIELISDTFTK